MFIRNNKDFPEIVPVNLTQSSVAACLQMLAHVRRIGVHMGRDVTVVDDILRMIDPVTADGKMRKDRSIDFILNSAQYHFLAANVGHFAEHEVHHNPARYVDCDAMTSLLFDITYAGAAATTDVETSS